MNSYIISYISTRNEKRLFGLVVIYNCESLYEAKTKAVKVLEDMGDSDIQIGQDLIAKGYVQSIFDGFEPDLSFVENIFEYGLEKIDQLRREHSQLIGNQKLGIGEFSPYLSLN